MLLTQGDWVSCGAGFPACQLAEGRLESLPHIPLSQQHCRGKGAMEAAFIEGAFRRSLNQHHIRQ
jgi:hypothetical protein